MSFSEFIEHKYGVAEDMARVYHDQILEESALLENAGQARKAEHLDNIGRMINECLNNLNMVDVNLAKAIEIATERVINAMEDDIGRIHTGLRHIDQLHHASEDYEPRLKDKLTTQFHQSNSFMYSFSSFLKFDNNGHPRLSSWGDHVLERLAERQILQIMDMDEQAQAIKRAYPAYPGQ